MMKSRTRVVLAATLLAAFVLPGCDGKPPKAGGQADHDDHDDGDDHDDHAEEAGHDDHGEEAGHDDHGEEAGHEGEGAEIKLEPKQVELAGIKSVEAKRVDVGVELNLTGEIAVNEDRLAHLVARVPGVVRHVHATLGARVQEGELLADLESSELGEAKASVLERKQQLDLAQADLERVQTIHDNTVRMLAVLEGPSPSDELKALKGLDLGENRSTLVSAYSAFVLARAKHQREKDLFERKISSDSELIEAETEHKTAEANLSATRDQMAFAIRRSLLEQQRSHRVAQLSLTTARRKLLLLGVTENEIRCEACGVDFPLDVREKTDCKACLKAREGLPEEGEAGTALARYALKAPFAGTVIEKHLTLGEQVDSETNLYSLSNMETVWVIANVYERDLARVKADQTAAIAVKAYPGRTFSGRVTWVADLMEEETRTLKIRMLADNADRLLKPGMFARVALSVETRQGALTVPPSAIQTQKGESIVFVDEGSGTFERREVEIGMRSSTAVELLSGVKEGERVVTEGSFLLKSELEKEGFHAGHAH